MVIDNTLPRTHIDQPKPINALKRKESRSKSPLTSLTVHKNNVWSSRSKSPSSSTNTPTIGSTIITVDETTSNASSRSTTPMSEIDWSDLPSPDRGIHPEVLTFLLGSKSVEEIAQQLKNALEKNPMEQNTTLEETKTPTQVQSQSTNSTTKQDVKEENSSSDIIGIFVLLFSFFIAYLVYLYQTKKLL